MTTTDDLVSPLPSPAAHSRNSGWSPLASILSLVALIGIPTLIYAFFFAIKCPPNPFRPRRRSPGRITGGSTTKSGHFESVSTVKYMKQEHGKENCGECPVCLLAFVDGGEVRQLNACNHTFHVACIDTWLCSHSSCPVCRASIAVKRPRRPAVNGDGEDDLRQGLPDSANLV